MRIHRFNNQDKQGQGHPPFPTAVPTHKDTHYFQQAFRLARLNDETRTPGKGAGNDAYVFDAADRMQAVTGKESYRYDGYGRRVRVTRSSDGKTDYPIYAMGGILLTEDDQRSNTRTDYVNLNGLLVAKRVATLGTSTWTTTYEPTDALHSPNTETDAADTATRIEHYTPYSEPGDGRYVQGPGYTGHVTDAATGLTYAQKQGHPPFPTPVPPRSALLQIRFHFGAW